MITQIETSKIEDFVNEVWYINQSLKEKHGIDALEDLELEYQGFLCKIESLNEDINKYNTTVVPEMDSSDFVLKARYLEVREEEINSEKKEFKEWFVELYERFGKNFEAYLNDEYVIEIGKLMNLYFDIEDYFKQEIREEIPMKAEEVKKEAEEIIAEDAFVEKVLNGIK